MPASEEAAKAAREKWRAPRITEAAMAERATVGPGLAPAELRRTTHRLLKWRFRSGDLMPLAQNLNSGWRLVAFLNEGKQLLRPSNWRRSGRLRAEDSIMKLEVCNKRERRGDRQQPAHLKTDRASEVQRRTHSRRVARSASSALTSDASPSSRPSIRR